MAVNQTLVLFQTAASNDNRNRKAACEALTKLANDGVVDPLKIAMAEALAKVCDDNDLHWSVEWQAERLVLWVRPNCTLGVQCEVTNSGIADALRYANSFSR